MAHVSACSIEFGTVAAPFVIPDAAEVMIFGGAILDLSAAAFLDGEGTLELSGEIETDDSREPRDFRCDAA